MNPIGHFHTITEHKLLVMKHCFKIGLYRQGLLHDMSKYMPCEFLVGAKYYQGTRSPNNAEREAKGYSAAWLHHKGRNKHHFEYWIDYGLENGHNMEGMRMPRKYVAEMLADRIAASKVYNKGTYTQHHPLEYFLKGKSHYMIHPKTQQELEHLLRILDKYGEDVCFDYVKNVYLRKKPLSAKIRRINRKMASSKTLIAGYDK
ncbi:MAG: DUF5662 family protein [Eubacteriales bacterium]|nr:DUF5662 family protein [Eubacteriales bacterium]